MTNVIRLATRSSAQAMTQSTVVADQLRSHGHDVEIITVETTGDLRLDVPIHEMGGQGVFVKEVQRAVLDGRADLAVHSAKDLPSVTADGLVIGAFTKRRNPNDALIGRRFDQLESGAVVATGSIRRRSQLAERRPDLHFVELRGNIASRLSKVPEHGAIVMAVAALEILGLTDLIAEELDPAFFVPAVGQGCVAVECRDSDSPVLEALAKIDHAPTRAAVEVERAFLGRLGSGCSLPVGAHVADGTLSGYLSAGNGGRVERRHATLTADHGDNLEMARQLAADSQESLTPDTNRDVTGGVADDHTGNHADDLNDGRDR